MKFQAFLILLTVLLASCGAEETPEHGLPTDTVAVPVDTAPERSANAPFDDFRPGDLVFQKCVLPRFSGHESVIGGAYNNVGIINVRPADSAVIVIDVKTNVATSPLRKWVNYGMNGSYVVKRLKDYDIMMNEQTFKLLAHTLKTDFANKPFDHFYDWSDEAVYPAEFVWKLYKAAFIVELCGFRALGDFDAANTDRSNAFNDYYKGEVPADMQLIHIDDLANSSYLITVYEN